MKIINESPTTFDRLEVGEWFTVQAQPRVWVKIEKSIIDGSVSNATPTHGGSLSSKLFAPDTEVTLIQVEEEPCEHDEFLDVLKFLLILKTIEDFAAEIGGATEKVPGYEQWADTRFAKWMKAAEVIEEEEKDDEAPEQEQENEGDYEG